MTADTDTMPALPEPDAWRIRYRSEPGMLGHYPWSYEERKRSAVGRTEFDVEPIYAADTVRAHIESTAAEIARLQSELSTLRASTASVQADQRAEVERLRAECEALRKDAVRYRWLRGGKARTGGGTRRGRIEVFRWQDRSEGEQLKGEALDAAIDAALSTNTAPSGAEE